MSSGKSYEYRVFSNNYSGMVGHLNLLRSRNINYLIIHIQYIEALDVVRYVLLGDFTKLDDEV